MMWWQPSLRDLAWTAVYALLERLYRPCRRCRE
jgi:hypothetical protein